jgi:hypothetical protein
MCLSQERSGLPFGKYGLEEGHGIGWNSGIFLIQVFEKDFSYLVQLWVVTDKHGMGWIHDRLFAEPAFAPLSRNHGFASLLPSPTFHGQTMA